MASTINDYFPPNVPKRCKIVKSTNVSSDIQETTLNGTSCDKELGRLLSEFKQLEASPGSIFSIFFPGKGNKSFCSQTVECSSVSGACVVNFSHTSFIDNVPITESTDITLTRL